MFYHQVLINVLEKYLHQAIEIPKCLLKVIPGHLLSRAYSPIILTFFFSSPKGFCYFPASVFAFTILPVK